MKKKGFTLQELLITMAIIGIVAAITAPALVNSLPDERKTKYMKAYNTLTNLTSEILGDSSYYWTEGYYVNGEPNCIGLGCVNMPKPNGVGGTTLGGDDNFTVFWNTNPSLHDALLQATGKNNKDQLRNSWRTITLPIRKFPIIMSTKLNLQNGISCSNRACNFTTTDGIYWEITGTSSVVTAANPTRRISYNVLVDVDSSNNAQNTVYGSIPSATTLTKIQWNKIKDKDFINDVNNVDTFMFKVDNNGSVSADDALGIVYLKTPTDMHRKKEDKQSAAAKLREARDELKSDAQAKGWEEKEDTTE